MDKERRDLLTGSLSAGAGIAAVAAAASPAEAQQRSNVPRYIRHTPERRYAKACVVGNMIYMSGEDSKEMATERVQGTTTAEQTDITFQNMKATLESLGSSLENVIKITVYLKDPRDRGQYGQAAGKYLPHAPAATLIMGVQLAEPQMLVEVDAIAVIPG